MQRKVQPRVPRAKPKAIRAEIARQVAIAREGMRRYAPALRDLAR